MTDELMRRGDGAGRGWTWRIRRQEGEGSWARQEPPWPLEHFSGAPQPVTGVCGFREVRRGPGGGMEKTCRLLVERRGESKSVLCD